VPSAFHDEWTWADLRTGAEALDTLGYLKLRYYEKWLGCITEFFIDNGYVSEDELAARAAELTEPSASAVGDPEWHAGTKAFTFERLMDLVGTESMMGVALAGPGT
jgi:hypothetical protein